MKNQHIALDMGIKSTVTTSTGEKYHLPEKIRKLQKEIIQLQKKLSRQEKNSHNYEKTRIKIAKKHRKIHNIIDDYYHKLSIKLIKENQVISVETLNIDGMLKNHNLARSIQTQSWNNLFYKLKYKAEWHNRTLIKIDQFFPSTKQCHNCGYKMENLTLKDRTWQCPQCNTIRPEN